MSSNPGSLLSSQFAVRSSQVLFRGNTLPCFFFAVLSFFPEPVAEECLSADKRHRGICMNTYDCRMQRGTVHGQCALGFGVCCICKYLFPSLFLSHFSFRRKVKQNPCCRVFAFRSFICAIRPVNLPPFSRLLSRFFGFSTFVSCTRIHFLFIARSVSVLCPMNRGVY